MSNKLISISLLLIIIFGFVVSVYSSELDNIGYNEDEAISVYDLEGNYVFSIAMGMAEGDRYISQENVEYVIEAVNGNRAVARKIGKINLLEGFGEEVSALTPLAAKGSKIVGIYHTHNDESYLPGPESIEGEGEVHEIGKALKEALEKKGIRVIHLNNLHLPHDGGAYERSKATALDLLKQRPDAILDLHRDAIESKKEYLENVNGQLISQVRLVVGRQNPNKAVNDKFARQFKTIVDNHYAGLIRDIFYASGAYNQELFPRSLLLEFGTFVTSKEQAKASAEMLAESLNLLLYGGQGNQPASGVKSKENSSSISSVIWIIAIVAIGLFIYLFINEGSIEGVIRKLKGFFSKEFLDRGDKN